MKQYGIRMNVSEKFDNYKRMRKKQKLRVIASIGARNKNGEGFVKRRKEQKPGEVGPNQRTGMEKDCAIGQ